MYTRQFVLLTICMVYLCICYPPIATPTAQVRVQDNAGNNRSLHCPPFGHQSAVLSVTCAGHVFHLN